MKSYKENWKKLIGIGVVALDRTSGPDRYWDVYHEK